MHIEIFSDFTCPFCYIAKKRLQRAIAELQLGQHVTIDYKAYELNPHAPIETTQYIEAMTDKITAAKQQALRESITALAAEEGLTYNFEGMRPGNTRTLHRLTKWAVTKQQADAFVERFMHAYFIEGFNMANEADVLVRIDELGLPVDEARAVMQSDAFSDELRRDAYDCQQIPVQSVPFFVFDNRFGIKGVEPIEVFKRTLQQIVPPPSTGASCTINGCDE